MSGTLDYRVVMGLDYPALTGAFSDTFSADLDPATWVFTEYGGPPLVTGGKLHIQLFGAACRQFAVLRPHNFPRDLTKKFTITFNAAFPAEDPIYDAVITVGTINNGLGSMQEPFRIVQRGSTHSILPTTGADIGDIFYSLNGGFPQAFSNGITNNQADHEYKIIYDPAVWPYLEVQVDSTVVFPAPGDTVAAGARPYYVMFGMLQRDGGLDNAATARAAAGLTPPDPNGVLNPTDSSDDADPLSIITVSDISVTCTSYETRTYPSWTTANAGGTLDTAADGERFSLDGETWAKLPKSQIASVRTTVGRSLNQPSDTVELGLLAPLASAPGTTPDRFAGTLMSHRPLLVDTRIGEDVTDTWTDWRRQICAIVESKERDGMRVRVTGRDRPSAKLDTFFARGYFDFDIDTDAQDGPADGARSGLRLDQIFQDLVDVADAIYGDKLGLTNTLIRQLDHVPQMLDSGGGALISVIQEWVDRAAQEMWREYTVTGDARYGRLRINTWTTGGVSVYTFRGHGATNPNILAPGVRFMQDPRRGAGQAYYRNDSPVSGEETIDTFEKQPVGTFPSFSYPPNDRVLNDSYGPFATWALSVLNPLHDKDGNNILGGVAMYRYRMENSFRRSVEFSAVGHNWLAPAQVITIDDEDGTGITTAETWVVDNVETVIESGVLRVRVQATSTDWLSAIRSTM